ncbi:MAG: hypothetical protein GY866_22775 [Proteobacteria bacterium]|nr:hypothetical protein [Pseudomonadota bacterium]
MDYAQKIQELLKTLVGNPTELYTRYEQINRKWYDNLERAILKRKESPFITKQELFEYREAKGLLDNMMNRIDQLKGLDDEMKTKYLKIIEPFYSEEGTRNLLFHYFDFDEKIKTRGEIVFKRKSPFQKEVNIIYDLYRSKMTTESISTIIKVLLTQETIFESVLSVNERYEFLTTLMEILKLLFVKLIKDKYKGVIYKKLGTNALHPKNLMNQRETNNSLVAEAQLKNNVFRKLFFLVYFSTKMRSSVSDLEIDLDLNYFNYELIKKEYLIDWMHTKLKGNEQKKETLNKHQIGDEKVGDLVEENPDQEAKILDSISVEEFNDIAEEINEKVDDELKAPIATLSKKRGSFAKFHKTFVKAQSLAKMSVDKMKKSIGKSLSMGKKKKEMKPIDLPETTRVEEKPAAVVPFHIDVLETHQIDFAYLMEEVEAYDKNLDFIERKLGDDFNKLRSDIWKVFTNISDRHFSRRKEGDLNEWALPFYLRHVEGGEEEHLLVLGAKIVRQDKDADLKASLTGKETAKLALHEVRPYFVFATNESENSFGTAIKVRKVKTVDFYQYKFYMQTVLDQVTKTIDWILKQQESSVFESSGIEFKEPDEFS